MNSKLVASSLAIGLVGMLPAWGQSTPSASPATTASNRSNLISSSAAVPAIKSEIVSQGFAESVSSQGGATAPAGSFSPSRAVATSRLVGNVSQVSVQRIGNDASANATGGAGGSANGGSGGSGVGSSAYSGTGGGESGGNGGTKTMGAGYYGDAGAGGGVGGSGGAATAGQSNAGVLNLSNTLSKVAKQATGIVTLSQNSGIGALTQQSVNVQGNIFSGK